jgi:hypothetical protein
VLFLLLVQVHKARPAVLVRLAPLVRQASLGLAYCQGKEGGDVWTWEGGFGIEPLIMDVNCLGQLPATGGPQFD